MRVWVVCLLLLGCSLAEKEVLDDDTFNSLTEDLISEIRKRISEDSLMSDPAQTCEDSYGLSTSSDSIIMTRDSIDNGAEFIQAPVVESGRECMQACCDEDNCNVAVFKDKDLSHSCYLFDCGNPGMCQYANHTGFTVLHLPHKKTAKVQGKNHEEDLVKLATTTTPTTTTTISTTTTLAEVEDQPVPLFGECTADKDCAGSKTVCQVNYCVCKDGYHAQDGECKPPKSGEPTDTSDKEEDSDDHEGGWDDNDSQFKTHDDSDDAAEDSNEEENQPSSKPTDQTGDDNDSEEKAKVKAAEKAKAKAEADTSAETSAEPDQAPVKQGDSQPDSREQVNIADTSDAKVEPVLGDVQVNKEEQPLDGEPTKMESNQGAVIALALGLSVTALLLVFVGCRLRSVKRRLRRGRPLSSNEADYLVNGMYL